MRKSATAHSENAFAAFLKSQAATDLLSPLSFYSAQSGLFTGSLFTWTVPGSNPSSRSR